MMLTRAAQNNLRLRTSYLEIFDFVRSRRVPTAPSYVRINSSRRAFHGGSGLRQQAGNPSRQPQFLETYKKAGTS
jgi:aspartyl-tRNA synthetase